MKKSQILSFFLAFFCSVVVQANSEPAKPETKSGVVIPKFYELEGEQWRAWQKIQQEWIKTEYPKILQEQKLQMNCNGCENIYMDAVFSIDAQGKLKQFQLVNSKKCADKFSQTLVKRFTDWFFRLQFPPALYGLNFEVRLGTGLSC